MENSTFRGATAASTSGNSSLPINHASENAKWTAEYRSVCLARPPDYSYYGELAITWGDLENYECHHKLGKKTPMQRKIF